MLWGKHYYGYSKWVYGNFLPMLLDKKVDIYLNGHEHLAAYTNYPYAQVDPEIINHDDETHNLEAYECHAPYTVEWFFGEETREQTFTKGHHLHTVTTGHSGCFPYMVCEGVPAAGRYYYNQNIYNGFTHIHVEEAKVEIKILGLDNEKDDMYELYKITINNDKVDKPDRVIQ